MRLIITPYILSTRNNQPLTKIINKFYENYKKGQKNTEQPNSWTKKATAYLLISRTSSVWNAVGMETESEEQTILKRNRALAKGWTPLNKFSLSAVGGITLIEFKRRSAIAPSNQLKEFDVPHFGVMNRTGPSTRIICKRRRNEMANSWM